MDYKNYIVTGQRGFIGSALWEALPQSATLHGMDRADSEEFDVTDYFNLLTILPELKEGCFVHLASPCSNRSFVPNMAAHHEAVSGFINALSFAKARDLKFVFPSSATAYYGTTDYAKSKIIFEQIAQLYYSASIYPRVFAGYGPGEDNKGTNASVIYQWLTAIAEGEDTIEIWGDGGQVRDFIYIDDIIGALIALVKADKNGPTPIGTGCGTSFNELIDIIQGVTRTRLKIEYKPLPVGYIYETLQDVSELYDYYEPKTDIYEGVKKTWQYIKHQ